jgi:cold shock CspA family protein/ribosome-associated translation inhibitor RaiA
MQVSPQITFQNMEPSDEVRAQVEREVERLESFDPRITACRIAITAPETRHHTGEPFRVEIAIAVPGHQDIVVDHRHGDAAAHEHLPVALRDAFHAARRQLEDRVREIRGDVKHHDAQVHGRVVRLLPEQDCGFIETIDGGDLYFHRNSVVGTSFDHIQIGDTVRFVETMGVKGPQASTVHPMGKRRS